MNSQAMFKLMHFCFERRNKYYLAWLSECYSTLGVRPGMHMDLVELYFSLASQQPGICCISVFGPSFCAQQKSWISDEGTFIEKIKP